MALVESHAPELVPHILADELVAGLLVANGLHPDDLETRIAKALDGVRPFMAGHGGDVELLDIDERVGAVRLRLLGSCDGCPSSAITLRATVERAIFDAAPEIGIIDVDEPNARGVETPTVPGVETPISLGRKPQQRPLTQPRHEQAKPQPGERCELCAALIPDDHGHVVDLESRALMCTCRPCYLVFEPQGAGGSRFRAVPNRYMSFPELSVSTSQWDALQIPVGVAFFFMNSTTGQLAAFYPGPAGATESLLPLDAWQELVADNPGLDTLQPDVEALLVRGTECYLVPIDVCYELVGRLRVVWKGFDGGAEAHAALDAFFGRICANVAVAR